MGKGYGFGKTIFFGDHFVNYGLPGIASALELRTIAEVQRSDRYELLDERPETPGYKKKKFGQQLDSLKRIFSAIGIDAKVSEMRIGLSGNLKAASGVGASAASCAAIVRALNEEFRLGFDDDKVNDITFEGERGYHGSPSGIDNTCAVLGGLIWFKKDFEGQKNRVEKIRLQEPVEIVLGNTGLTSNTLEVVSDVRKRKEADPEMFEGVFSEYGEIVTEGRKAFERFDLETVGNLMDKNHELLRQVGVSCPELDLLVKTARANGALGAKLTGTGRGGLILALTPGKELQKIVAQAIEEKGFETLETKIGS